MSVRAFQPRSTDPPQFVAEDLDALAELVGEYIGAEQCDGCGNHSYRIERLAGHVGTFRYIARCAGDPTEAAEFRHPDPCGKAYAIGLYADELVTF